MRVLRPLAVLAFLGLSACAPSPAAPGPITWTPRGEVDDGDSSSGQLPDGFRSAVPTSLDTDFFSFTGPPVAGTASFDGAVVWDPFASDVPPFGMGAVGAIDTSVDGITYHVTDGEGVAMLYTDEDGDQHLVLSIFSEVMTATGWEQRNVAVIVNASDFAPGATVALDGDQRVAIFAAGPDTAPEPTIFAAAITGSITFAASGSLAVGDRISATLSADFAPAMSIPALPTGTPLVAGDYDLVIDPMANVVCGGTMEGHEAAFAGVTLTDLGTTDGTVTLALPTAEQLTISGAAIGTRWGTPALFDAVANPPDTFIALADETGAGPDATELAGSYALLEGMPETASLAHVALGLSYVDPIGDGGCDVVFQAELHAH